MDPFHLVSLAGDKLDQCRRRIQRAITGRRGRAGDRLYQARRTTLTEAGLLTNTQARCLETLFADDRHAAVQASWGVYQHLIQAYRTEEAGLGKYLTQQLIDSLKQATPEGLEEIQTLARTPTEKASDTPGLLRPPPHLQRPHAKPSTDAWSTYTASPWDLRNLTHYTIRSLIHTGRLKDHPAATT